MTEAMIPNMPMMTIATVWMMEPIRPLCVHVYVSTDTVKVEEIVIVIT